MFKKIFFYFNMLLLTNSFKKISFIKMITNDEVNKILKFKNYINQEDSFTLIQNIKNKKITELVFNPTYNEIYSLDNDNDNENDNENEGINNDPSTKDFENINNYHFTKINPFLAKNIVDLSVNNNIKTTFLEQPIQYNIFNTFNSIGNIAFSILGIILLRNLLSMVFNSKSSNFTNFSPPSFPSFGFTNLNKDKIVLEKLNISLSSWAGSQEVFEECTEIVSFLKNSSMYKEAGAELPKGILLEGLPGTGKTLLAKAIASECEANFISISASEFIELYIGMGALRVRKLFETARNNKPCIIFIDEIDTIGKQRGSGPSLGSNDEREQTLNQLLTEMDGFKENDGIIIIGATNLKSVLDKALLRPGRFDRIINIPLPDKLSRQKILNLYLQNKNTDININMEDIADLTSGFSGADLKNLINEATMSAVRRGTKIINFRDISDSLEKLLVGIIKKNDDRSLDIQKRVAIHEIGHAYLANYFEKNFNFQKVTIQSTYSGAGGYTLFNELPEIVDGGLYTKDALVKRLIVMLGGKAAENIFYGKDLVSLGATQDLKEANSLAKKMINNWGFGNNLEVFYNENLKDKFYNENSEKRIEQIDKESYKIVVDAYLEAKEILYNNKELIEKLTIELIEKKTIYKEEFINLIDFYSI